MSNVKRGEIYFCDLGEEKGSVQGGYRPVLIVQANRINTNSSTVLVAPITSVEKKNTNFHISLGTDCGLAKQSMVLFEQIRVVNVSELKKYIGQISQQEYIRLMNTSLKKTFGLWRYREERTGDVRCLCKKHLDEYKNMPNYIIKRFQPTQVIKDKCDKCNNLGYDYMFFEKENVLRKGVLKYGQ